MRLQLALNVSNLEQAVAYYSRLFGVAPHKRRPGYANFAIDDPALKLVLFEKPQTSRYGGNRNQPDDEPVVAAKCSADQVPDQPHAGQIKLQVGEAEVYEMCADKTPKRPSGDSLPVKRQQLPCRIPKQAKHNGRHRDCQNWQPDRKCVPFPVQQVALV